MSNTEKLMRKYAMLSAAWDECTMIWKGIEQNGTVHKFNRKILQNSVDNKQSNKTNDRFIGGKDNMITQLGKPGDADRIEALRLHYENTVEESPFLE